MYLANTVEISDIFMRPNQYHGFSLSGVGGQEAVGWAVVAGWEPKVGSYIYFNKKSSHCVFIEVHKQPQFTCKADMVADSSLIASVALLVYPSGTVLSIVDCHEFRGSQK